LRGWGIAWNARNAAEFTQSKEDTMATQIIMDRTGDSRHDFDPTGLPVPRIGG
jgi:hypothetical protein